MTCRWVACALAVFIGFACLTPPHAAGQTPKKKVWTPPRTPDGQPDFQGVWAISTLTPVERPAEFAGKAFLSEQEAAEYEKRMLEELNSDRRDGGPEADLRRNYNEFWRDRGTTIVASRRTSLIVDPPDGKIPAFTSEARKKQAAHSESARGLGGPEALALRIRCISRDLPMIPTPNNNFVQIIQGPGYVAILHEMM